MTDDISEVVFSVHIECLSLVRLHNKDNWKRIKKQYNN